MKSTQISLEANDKFGEPALKILIFANSCIIQAPDAVRTDYPPSDMQISYSAVSEPWAGVGNLTANPLFADHSRGDYSLQSLSPCIDSGNPALAPDPDGTRCDMGALYYSQSNPPPFSFRRGRVNGDSEVDLADAVYILLHLFHGKPLGCAEAADVNDDGSLDVADAIALLSYLFLRGAALPAPAPESGACALDPTPDALGCSSTSCI